MEGIRPQRILLRFTHANPCLEGKAQSDVRVGSDCVPGWKTGGIRPQRILLRFTRTSTCLEGKAQSDVRVGSDCVPGWKMQLEERSVWAVKPCPCWCSGWAEVLIRGPSGNIAWIMRTENLQCQTGSIGDPSVPDITLLFTPLAAKSPDTDSTSKWDSGSLKEEEYDSVHADIFGWDSKSERLIFVVCFERVGGCVYPVGLPRFIWVGVFTG